MWNTERIPAELVRGMFIMIHKKGSRDDYGNYRAICLLCRSYKLISAVVARRLMAKLEDHLPDTLAGFRPARGCRDNVYPLKWFIQIATARVTAIANGSLNDAAMVISERKSMAMHIHPITRVSATKEAEVVALQLKHATDAPARSRRSEGSKSTSHDGAMAA